MRNGTPRADSLSTVASRPSRVAGSSGSATTSQPQSPADSTFVEFTLRTSSAPAFTAAATEAPSGGRIDAAAQSYRRDIHVLFNELAVAAGVSDPELLASQLQLVYDGGGLAANLDKNPEIATAARAAASALIATALAR